VALRRATKPTVPLELVVCSAPVVVGKSVAAVVPTTTRLPAGSTPAALACELAVPPAEPR
jgi:hypothetical protein